MSVKIVIGDCRDKIAELPDESVHCCVTSPPYWGLRDYGTARWEGGDSECEHTGVARRCDAPGRTDKQSTQRGSSSDRVSRSCLSCGAHRIDNQIGLETDFRTYIDQMVAVFREVRRVLRPDGTLWLNLGDSYAGGGNGGGGSFAQDGIRMRARPGTDKNVLSRHGDRGARHGLKPKDLFGIPWRVAFALQEDGWWLRQDIIWSKPNPMPERVIDRCTKAHEYLFLLSKSKRYYFDQAAVLEECSPHTHARLSQDVQAQIGSERAHAGGKTNGNMKAVARRGGGNRSHKGTKAYDAGASEHRTKASLVAFAEKQRKLAAVGSGIKNNGSMDAALAIMPTKRNKRSVWEVASMPFREAHFATFPAALIEPCILAGCPEGGTVLDPFGGAGTTGLVADRLGRNAILIELNPEYAEMALRRIERDAGLFAEVA